MAITDWAMPEMNGDKLAFAIKQLSPQQPVIMLTGFGDSLQASGQHLGKVDLVLSKPVTLGAFQEAMAKIE